MPISTIGTDGIAAANVTQAKLATNVAGNGPAFHAVMAANQTISTSSATKVTFSVEIFDTNNNYDTSLQRFTPTVAGYYQVIIGLISLSTDISQLLLVKNGSTLFGSYPNTTGGLNLVCLVPMNGSSDYIEAYVVMSPSGTLRDIDSFSFFQAYLARSA
jgi:hypothetical protein